LFKYIIQNVSKFLLSKMMSSVAVCTDCCSHWRHALYEGVFVDTEQFSAGWRRRIFIRSCLTQNCLVHRSRSSVPSKMERRHTQRYLSAFVC